MQFTEFMPGSTEHNTSSNVILENIDIRKEPCDVRIKLLEGVSIPIRINKCQVGTISLSLLRATAKYVPPDIERTGIELPADTDPKGVQILITHLAAVARNVYRPYSLRNNMKVYEYLAVCQASLRLGTTRYTNHILYRLFAYLSNHIPSHEEIDQVTSFSGTHWSLWTTMVNKLSATVREEKMPDPDGFARFCLERPFLTDALMETMKSQDAQLKRAREHAEEKERRQQWLASREQARSQRTPEQGLSREQQTERKKINEKHREEEKKRTAHVTAMRQACLAKTRASGKDRLMTTEEKKWYIKEYGKQPPRGC